MMVTGSPLTRPEAAAVVQVTIGGMSSRDTVKLSASEIFSDDRGVRSEESPKTRPFVTDLRRRPYRVERNRPQAVGGRTQ